MMYLVSYHQKYDNSWHEVGHSNPYPTKELAEEEKTRYELISPSNRVHIEEVEGVG